MVLTKYDRGLLEMMYLLTRKQSHMNPSGVARYLSEQGIRVTDRTVRRWFNYLQTHRFDYFPYPKFKAMGLTPVWVFTDFNEKILEAIPHKVAIVSGFDLRNLEKRLLGLYLVPTERLKDFSKLWADAVDAKALSFCQLLEVGSINSFYSPFHKLVDRNGIADFVDDHEPDNSYFTDMLRKSTGTESSAGMSPRICKNPLIIPVIWESFRKNASSQKIWNSFERRAGKAAWDYINNPKVRREKKTGCGIRHVQNTMREMQDNFGEFFQQMRVSYNPLYTHHNSMFYMLLKLKRREDIVPLSELLSKQAISIVAYPPRDAKSSLMMYYILTNAKESVNIISDLIQPYIDKSFDNRIITEDFKGTAKYRNPNMRHWKENYMMSCYHKLFDPVTCTWKFDTKAYAKKLNAAGIRQG
ncbi:MAG: hypothetical protein V1887_01910 [Candidatus Aenigmatarchaeota archaeon]